MLIFPELVYQVSGYRFTTVAPTFIAVIIAGYFSGLVAGLASATLITAYAFYYIDGGDPVRIAIVSATLFITATATGYLKKRNRKIEQDLRIVGELSVTESIDRLTHALVLIDKVSDFLSGNNDRQSIDECIDWFLTIETDDTIRKRLLFLKRTISDNPESLDLIRDALVIEFMVKIRDILANLASITQGWHYLGQERQRVIREHKLHH